MQCATLFSGGGGADIGMAAAGFRPAWAVEIDAASAAVYRANLGDHVIIADVCDIDYADLPYVDWLHASPVCTRYSVANAKRGETALDIATAQATARAIEAVEPRYVTIENVQQYAGSDALRLITNTLDRRGYWWHAEVLNAADYGVPQTRRRLIVRASLDMLRELPKAGRWIGWYEAIEDLIPTLPPAQFAPWQWARLPEAISGALLVEGRNGNGGSHPPRAFLVDSQNSGDHTKITIRHATEPSYTVMRDTGTRRPARAWLNAGRTVAMTPRALARFQSFPDWYRLPERKADACDIIGKAAPCRLMECIGENW